VNEKRTPAAAPTAAAFLVLRAKIGIRESRLIAALVFLMFHAQTFHFTGRCILFSVWVIHA
jgi:hypothetical protein